MLRSGHGKGAALRPGPRVEVAPPAELPPATPPLTVRSDRDQHGRFTAGNTASRARRLRADLSALQVDPADPRYKQLARWGRRYATHRRRELAESFGFVSAGVGLIVDSERLAIVASRYLEVLGSESGDPDLLRRASQLACDARQHSLAAWELCARESKARPAENPSTALARILAAEETKP